MTDSDERPGSGTGAGRPAVSSGTGSAFEVLQQEETQAKVRVRVTRVAFEAAIESEVRGLQQRARIPGFRPGKVPRSLLVRRLGESLHRDIRRKLFVNAFQEGVREHRLHPVESPVVQDEQLVPAGDGTMAIELDLEVIPHVEPTGYERFTVTPPAVEVRDEDVERELEGLRRQAAHAAEVADGESAAGDVVIADLALSFADGTSFPNKLENRIIDTGAGAVDGVACEEAKTAFAGARRGETRRVTMTLPETFPVEIHRGKTAITDCTVKDLRRVTLPDVASPEFLAQFKAADLDALKQQLRDRLGQMARAQQDRAVEELCVDQLLERHRIALPDAFVQRNLEAERERVRRELVNRGLPPADVEKQLLENEGRMRAEIERRLKEAFLLDRIAEKLEVEVGVQELENQFMLMARSWQVEPQKLFDHFQSQGLLPRVVEDVRRAKVRRQLREAAAQAESA